MLKSEEIKAMSKLSIPGLKVSFYKNQPSGLKVLWMVLFLLCAIVCVIQMTERICYFFTYPVVLNYEMAGAELAVYPKLTFCLQLPNSFGECEEESSSGEEDGHHDHQFLHLWDEIDKPFTHLIANCYTSKEEDDCLNQEYWTTRRSSIGVAYTMDMVLLSKNLNPWYVTFEMNEARIMKWKLLLHDDDDDISYGCLINSLPITKNHTSHFFYSRSQMIHEDVPVRPCVSTESYNRCTMHCLDKKFLNGSRCKMPFITTMDHLPLCDDCKQVRSIYENFRETMYRESLLDDCDCLRSCTDTALEFDIDTRDSEEEETKILVFSSRDEAAFLREQRSYLHYALFCDIGGIIGLNVGFCLLTFFEVFQVWLTIVYKHLTKPTGRPFARVTIDYNGNSIQRYTN